jgi:pimeloyl-ACP methyl ester carboxylesterase
VVSLLLVAAGVTGAGVADASTAAGDGAVGVRWRPCHTYSEQTLKWMVGPDQLAEFKALWARTQCGTLVVPLDYRRPNGAQITVAVTRLPAIDRAHRLGSIAINPGGPGGSGYLMPQRMVMAHENGSGAALNQRYDLIGFDPRGVGYSTRVDCPEPGPLPRMGPGPVTEDQARQAYHAIAAANRSCAATDPTFLGQLTTANVARDLDRIRRGLGEKRLSYLGISWGTLLGTVYRGLFPNSVQLMWLDSPAPPYVRSDAYVADRARATAQDVARFEAWLAARDARYAFGTTTAAVDAALIRLRQDYDVHPRTFIDLPGIVFDGSIIAQAAAGFSLSWPLAGPLLAAFRDTTGGTPAPPEVMLAFAPPPDDVPQPPADVPQDMNPTMNLAVMCNEDAGPRDFASTWTAYQNQVVRYPVTGQATAPIQPCAGWPLPLQPVPVLRSNAPLMMSAHRYENVSPYPWTRQTQAAVGGSILTVDDDVHASVASQPSDCPARLVGYFITGRPDTGECTGVPVPSDDPPSPAQLPTALNALRRQLTPPRTPPWATDDPGQAFHTPRLRSR